jgi:hypothetical protein
MFHHDQHSSSPSTALTERTTGRTVLRALLSSALVTSVFGNSVASAAGSGLTAHVALGAVTAICAAALLTDWLRARS